MKPLTTSRWPVFSGLKYSPIPLVELPKASVVQLSRRSVWVG